MGVIMVIVLFSRGLMVPVYLSQLGLISPLTEQTTNILKTTSFAIMKRARMRVAFTFDHHFSALGFRVLS
jgi:hypothetical protein